MFATPLLMMIAQVAAPASAGPTVVSLAITPPRSLQPLQRLISPDDYPQDAVRARQQGNVVVLLDVNPVGRIAACKIVQSSKSATLDMWTCRLLYSRARFTPARDNRTGAAISGQVLDRITWNLALARR